MFAKEGPRFAPPLPWQQPLWDQLVQAYEGKRLAHAILLTDPADFGQTDFAKAFAKYLLCHNQTSEQAHLFEIGNHPDFAHLKPIEDSTHIPIDAIRTLKNSLLKSGHAGGARVVILEPAHALNNAASNALLKLLEEPNEGVFFILVSGRPSQLSKTLLSRCQRFSFNAAHSDISLNWLIQQNMKPASAAYFLKLAEGAPLTALQLSETDSQQFRKEFLMDLHNLILSAVSPITIAEKWAKKEKLEILLEWIGRWLVDLVRLHHHSLEETKVPAPYLAILRKWQEKLDLEKIFEVSEKITDIRRLSSEIKSLNAQNNLETILILLENESNRV
jgi:DNA polymerase-3 subunit delta'